MFKINTYLVKKTSGTIAKYIKETILKQIKSLLITTLLTALSACQLVSPALVNYNHAYMDVAK